MISNNHNHHSLSPYEIHNKVFFSPLSSHWLQFHLGSWHHTDKCSDKVKSSHSAVTSGILVYSPCWDWHKEIRTHVVVHKPKGGLERIEDFGYYLLQQWECKDIVIRQSVSEEIGLNVIKKYINRLLWSGMFNGFSRNFKRELDNYQQDDEIDDPQHFWVPLHEQRSL